jgi:5,10-methenyltetrahydrofolate synthetase
MTEKDPPPTYASPPCFMHEMDDDGALPASDGGIPLRTDVGRWRKAERERLIAGRLAIPNDTRSAYGARIAAALEESIGAVSGLTISAYWPFRGEPDLRPFMDKMTSRRARCALPIVVERGAPLVFRSWRSGDPLERGIWNIPIPSEGLEVKPDIVIAPVVGFDPLGYRLGYGGGFFDRTLASLSSKPHVFGVGYGQAAIKTIYPQPHDIPMDAVITEDAVFSAPEATP